ncbi:amino acid ABC transporter ATP-binding protein [Isobaculum melis]|uniref:Amino acid ABC transporter ATP-binding protein, PAAT family n=1 Tax=Isobaculum melis TaxID=142588 RepID=A0A1H9RGX3_9LACT|nr:ATP-binding cassette domain-containing protein [Isobaculum melis]SER71934.1 amino acid ABC transporter ATP-binding protein, PAAT family [Isobaculum melis]
MTENRTILTAKNISKTFNGKVLLNNFNFSLKKNEIVSLVGASGSGKTTFMRILTALERADKGSVQIDQLALCETKENECQYAHKKQIKAYLQQIGLVFQDFQLFPHLSILENCLEAPLAQKLDSKQNLIQQATALLTQVQLADKIHVMPHTLSGGQKQRVAIARALMLNPKVLCFDEPTSALDQAASKTIGILLQEIAKTGTAILLVTHDLAFAEKFSTRTIDATTFLKKSSLANTKDISEMN